MDIDFWATIARSTITTQTDIGRVDIQAPAGEDVHVTIDGAPILDFPHSDDIDSLEDLIDYVRAQLAHA